MPSIGMSIFALDDAKSEESFRRSERWPREYVLDYPKATRFCVPVRDYFAQMERSQQSIGGKVVLHKPNGGFGLPTSLRGPGGDNLRHVGSDVAWHRVGEAVHAVAAGVVRISDGPENARRQNEEPGSTAGQNSKIDASRRASNRSAQVLEWGNIVVIEHRLPDDSFVTTVYGHLGPRRLVEVGDIVRAGQKIGEVGKNSKLVNGGYQPHLHLGVRLGRRAEPGRVLAFLERDGKPGPVRLVTLGSREIEIELPEWAPQTNLELRFGNSRFPATSRDGKRFVSSQALWPTPWRDFSMVGYSESTEYWLDPTVFLRSRRADPIPTPASNRLR